jgi:glycerophosphoryl diester phosphodiesterase
LRLIKAIGYLLGWLFIAMTGYFAAQYLFLRKRQLSPLMIIGHRGASGYAPENTIAAFLKAHNMGVDAVELDVQMSADSELVVLHDDALDRTTNGVGWVGFYTLEEIKKLDAGSWFDPKFKREKVPTLAQALDHARKWAYGLYIEMKDPAQYPGIEQKVADLLKQEKRELPGQAIVISFDHSSIRKLREISPNLTLGALYAHGPYFPGQGTRNETADAQVILPHWRSALLNPYMVRRLREQGKLVIVWTADHPVAARMLAYVGVDGIITNVPDKVMQALAPAAPQEDDEIASRDLVYHVAGPGEGL